MTETASERPFGYLQLWDAIADAIPHRECIVQGDRRLTWQDVKQRTTRLGWLLSSHGFGRRPGDCPDWSSPNDTVGLLLRNSPEFLEGCVGSYRSRCAPFNINYRYGAEELAYLLKDARPSALIYHAEFADVVDRALELVRDVRPLLLHVLDRSEGQPVLGSIEYEAALASASPPQVQPIPSPDDVHILYTGGTTGMPKGVLWRLRELAGNPTGISIESLESAAQAAPRRQWLRAHPAPPLMHGAASWFAYGAWARGGTVVLSEDHAFDAASALELLSAEHVTWMAIVGDAFALPLLEALRAGRPVPADLAYVFSSGARLSATAWAELESYFPGLKVVNALGSSETGPQAVQTSSEQSQFVAGPSTVVVGDDDNLLGAHHPGVGWLASSGELPRGYLNDRERTEATFRMVDGCRVSVSGDRAEVDESGEIQFLGREASVINTGGEKVYAEEVESVLRSLSDVADVVVLGRPSERWGAEVIALVVAEGDHRVTRDEIKTECSGRLAAYKLPKSIVHVPSIIRLNNGKLDIEWAQRTALSVASE